MIELLAHDTGQYRVRLVQRFLRDNSSHLVVIIHDLLSNETGIAPHGSDIVAACDGYVRVVEHFRSRAS